MKKLFSTLTAVILAAMLTVSAFAEEAVAENTPMPIDDAAVETAEAYPVIEGFDYVYISSSVSSVPGDIGFLFDGSTKTLCNLDMSDLPAEGRSVSIYATSVGPFTLTALAGVFSSTEENTKMQVAVYGTNDSLLVDWNKIELSQNIYELGDYVVFTNNDYEEGAEAPAEPAVYQFYRIDITLLEGSSFALSELVLFRTPGELVPTKYVEEGAEESETVEEAEATETAEETETAEVPAEEADEETAEAGLKFEGHKPFYRRIYPTPKPYAPAAK